MVVAKTSRAYKIPEKIWLKVQSEIRGKHKNQLTNIIQQRFNAKMRFYSRWQRHTVTNSLESTFVYF